MSISTPRLIRSRHGTYYFRLLVPPAARAAVGKREFRTSLGTKDPADARLRALRLSIIFEQTKGCARCGAEMKHLLDQLKQHAREFTIEKGRVEIKDAEDFALYQQAVAAGAVPPLMEVYRKGVPSGPGDGPPSALQGTPLAPSAGASFLFPTRLATALDDYKRHMESSADLGVRTKRDRATTVTHLVTYLSEHDEEKKTREWFVHEVHSRHIQRFFQWYPTRPGKAGRPPRKASSAGSTRTSLLGHLKGFFDFCIDANAIGRGANPVSEGLLKAAKKAKHSVASGKESYDPLEGPEISRIFDPATYLTATGGDAEFFWSPLLAAFTGARQGEIAQLTLGKIRREPQSGVHYILIDERVKNKNSIRSVPISDTLIELGFLRYAEHVRKLAADIPDMRADEVPLFPMQTRGDTFEINPGKRVSGFFARYLDSKEVGIKDPEGRKVFHSFRHTFITILRAYKEKVPFDDVQLLVGHAAQEGFARLDVGRQFVPVTDRYTHRDVEGLHTQTMIARLKGHLRYVHMPIDVPGLKAAADIVQERLLWDRKRGWKTGWHTNSDKVRDSMLARLQATSAGEQAPIATDHSTV